jgi:flagellar motor switch protein FliN/FliY
VKIEDPDVQTLSPAQLEEEIPKNVIVVETEHIDGLKGMTYLLFLKEHGAAMADLATGGDGTSPPDELTEIYMGALADALSKMIDAANASLSTKMGKTISSKPPKIKVIDFSKEEVDLDVLKEDQIVRITYNLKVGDLFEGNLIQLIPKDIAKPVIESIEEPKEREPEEKIQPVQFATTGPGVSEIPSNMQLLMDVPVEVSVELGRCERNLRDVLKMGPGYVMELDKMAGEPVDILVNGRLIAKGGVVVVDENFGVRITSIVNPAERLSTLQ